MRFSRTHLPRHKVSGFSLVEVVMAIGIVSFAMLTIIGLFGGLMKSSSENSDRREQVEAVDSLRAYLNESVEFSNAFVLARDREEVLYLTYFADTNGVPQSGSEHVFGFWTNSTATGLDAYEQARSGRWLRAKLSISPSNPSGTNGTTFSDYSNKSLLFVNAEIRVIAAPGQAATNQGALTTTLAVRR
jgi:type II secretory pathway pseudopilin PulG